MKRIIISILIFLISLNVYASSGSIKQSSVILCDGIYYGSHADHWHVVKEENGKYVIKDSKELEAPSCYVKKENESEIVELSKCVDGDTAKFKMSDGSIKTARFLAIDTPESVHPTKAVEAYGKEASEFTCHLLTKAKTIKIEYDKASDKTDKYGRLLVWVYADNELVQEVLLKEGLAKVAYLYADYEYTSHLQEVEKTAKTKKLKIWSDDNIAGNMDATEDSDSQETSSNFIEELFNLIKDFLCDMFNKIIKFLDTSKIFVKH